MMTDPIADMLTRIRNASAASKKQVEMPCSRMKKEIARVLKEEGYIKDFEIVENGKFQSLVLTLLYLDKKPAIRLLKRLSKPGCRVYVTADELLVVMNNLGISILSTSKGIMTNRKAKNSHVGGEILCEVA